MILMGVHTLISSLKTDYRKTLFLYTVLVNKKHKTEAHHSVNIEDLHQELYLFQIDDLKTTLEMYKKYKFNHTILDQLGGNKRSDGRLVHYLLSCCYNSYTYYKTYIPESLIFTDPLLHLQALLDYINYESYISIKKKPSFSKVEKTDNEVDFFLNKYNSIFNSNQWINNKDDDQLNWIINYIKSYIDRNLSTTNVTDRMLQKRISEFKDSYRSKPSLNVGLELKEKALGVMYFFDTLHMTTKPEIAENLNLKIRKAYSQRKYRNESEGKSSSNYMLRAEVKEKLKELAKAERLKLNETIELLIEEAHKKLKTK
ncbi:MAG: macrodomain Ter protein organizer (MatP/YcbG family) [Pseudoalteromonas rhizosphaerae]